MKPVRVALTKGRLEDKTRELFTIAGIDDTAFAEKGRKLVLPIPGDAFPDGAIRSCGAEIVLAKAADVITYVEHGVCDVGVVGKDTIMEHARSLYEVLDLGFGVCRFALAAKKGTDFYAGFRVKRVASKYPNVTREFFARKGMDVEIIKIEGSVELAPLLGLADAIVDIVETGSTLRANGLEVIENVAPVSARVVVNIASMKMRKREIESFVDMLRVSSEKLKNLK